MVQIFQGDQKALDTSQEENDVVRAQEILQNTFFTNVCALVAEAAWHSRAVLNPVGLYQDLAVRKALISKRGGKTVVTGS